MTKTLGMNGIAVSEIHWIRILIFLLRHPDPTVPELARQALLYLADAAGKRDFSQNSAVKQAT